MADTSRAKQFMPFAALRGYYDRIQAKNRVVEPKKEIVADEAERLSDKLSQVKKNMMVRVRYYQTDAYVNIEGIVTRIDPEFRYLTIVKTKIPFDDIVDVSGDGIVENK